MKNLVFILSLLVVFSCSSDDTSVDEFTGNEISYNLFSASDIGSAGSVTFRERTNGAVDIVVTLDGEFSGSFPVHLHYGDLSIEDAPQATLLADYSGPDKNSTTTLTILADETPFTFDLVDEFNGSVKVHLGNNGPEYDVLIAAGNIGSNEDMGFNLMGIANCGEEIQF